MVEEEQKKKVHLPDGQQPIITIQPWRFDGYQLLTTA